MPKSGCNHTSVIRRRFDPTPSTIITDQVRNCFGNLMNPRPNPATHSRHTPLWSVSRIPTYFIWTEANGRIASGSFEPGDGERELCTKRWRKGELSCRFDLNRTLPLRRENVNFCSFGSQSVRSKKENISWYRKFKLYWKTEKWLLSSRDCSAERGWNSPGISNSGKRGQKSNSQW